MADADEVHALQMVSERLRGKFPDARPEGIAQLVNEAHHQFDGSPVRAFIPVLVEREVADRLRLPSPRTAPDASAATG